MSDIGSLDASAAISNRATPLAAKRFATWRGDKRKLGKTSAAVRRFVCIPRTGWCSEWESNP
jgi:hypothetical protein